MPAAEFDAYAGDYDAALAQGVRLSGESSAFFARERVAWLGRRLGQLGVPAGTVLDFGCGTGATAPFLLGLEGATELVGTDVSGELLDVARRDHGSDRATFIARAEPRMGGFDVAYCNGVFHHVPPAERASAVAYVHASLRPGGLFALWENNPWNPATRMVMRRIPFDRDAETLSAPATRRMLRAGGFEIMGTDFLFVFPRALRALRPLERRLSRLPLGAQYLVLARRQPA